MSEWQRIETAPKSLANGSHIQGIYLLGFCPEEGVDPKGCIEIIWWEPLTESFSGELGCWFGASAWEMHPTHWMPLPTPPQP